MAGKLNRAGKSTLSCELTTTGRLGIETERRTRTPGSPL